MEAAWKGILTEAERLSDVHLKVKENLCCGEIQQIKTWQKDNYHKVSCEVNATHKRRHKKNGNYSISLDVSRIMTKFSHTQCVHIIQRYSIYTIFDFRQ